MGFNDNLKLEVKHKSAFRCCRCQSIGVEIHHIIPQADGGADTIDNAAPLCSKCHSDFGGNPRKRKEIREMRDWWYEKVTLQHSSDDPRLTSIENKLDQLLTGQEQKNLPLGQAKNFIKEYLEIYLERANNENIQQMISSVVNIEKPPFIAGSPCQMSGQPCPSVNCPDGIMDVDSSQEGVSCHKCGLFIPVVYPRQL